MRDRGGFLGLGVLTGRLLKRVLPDQDRVRSLQDQARAQRDEEVQRLTPGERIELAFRLSEMQLEFRRAGRGKP